MTSTPAIGSVCASHAECDAIAFAYCASASGGGAQRAGACMSCDDCALHADGIDGACPSTCATRTMTSGVGATGADEFFEDFGYWVKVRDGAAVSSGCTASANEATTTTTASTKGRTSSCFRVFTKRASDRWCDVGALTRQYPYSACIADGVNDYCGVGSSDVCVGKTSFDCCPLRADVLSGVVIAVVVVLCVVQFFIYRAIYHRKLVRSREFWNNPRIAEAARKACERYPSLKPKAMPKAENAVTIEIERAPAANA